jgi:hypothetical protein
MSKAADLAMQHGFQSLKHPFYVRALAVNLGNLSGTHFIWQVAPQPDDVHISRVRLVQCQLHPPPGGLQRLRADTLLTHFASLDPCASDPLPLLTCSELARVDPFLGTGAQVVNDLQQQIDQRIGQLLLTPPAEHGHHAVADRGWAAPSFADRFRRAALAELLDEFGGDIVEQLRNQADLVDALKLGIGGDLSRLALPGSVLRLPKEMVVDSTLRASPGSGSSPASSRSMADLLRALNRA